MAWYHGTPTALPVGTLLREFRAEELGVEPFVYFTDDPAYAATYARKGHSPEMARIMHIEPHVYEVEPIGPITESPTGWKAPSARVLREVTIEALGAQKAASAFQPAQVAAWTASKPWDAPRAVLEAQEVPGVRVGRARGTEAASFEGGMIVLKDEWFTYPSESRKAVMYHEAGHGLETAAGSAEIAKAFGVANPLDVIDLPGASRFGHNYGEIVATAYQVAWMEPGWASFEGGSEILAAVGRLASEYGWPTPPGAHTASTEKPRLFHGTPHALPIGTILVPGGPDGSLTHGRANRGAWVWLTPSAADALDWAGPGGHAYEVDTTDARPSWTGFEPGDRNAPIGSYPMWVAPQARILHEVGPRGGRKKAATETPRLRPTGPTAAPFARIEQAVGEPIEVLLMSKPGNKNHHLSVSTYGTENPMYPRFTDRKGRKPVASIVWSQTTGVIAGILVEAPYQRRGIATALLDLAKASGLKPEPVHSDVRTSDGAAWVESLGSVLAGIDRLKGEDGKRRLSLREVERKCREVVDAVGHEHGVDLSKVEIVLDVDYLPPMVDARYEAEGRNRWTTQSRILVSTYLTDDLRDPDTGIQGFRQIAHEATHAASDQLFIYEGHTQEFEEAATEILSVWHWAHEGQPFGQADAFREDGKWIDGARALVHRSNYREWIGQVLRRAASKVGWQPSTMVAYIAATHRNHRAVLDFMMDNDPEFAPPPGVSGDGESLLLWLITEGMAKRAVTAALDPAFEFDVRVTPAWGKVWVSHPSLEGQAAGVLVWDSPRMPTKYRSVGGAKGEGVIRQVSVHERFRRQGLATEMLRRARESVPYPIVHSTVLSEDGAAWSVKVGARDPLAIERDDNGYRYEVWSGKYPSVLAFPSSGASSIGSMHLKARAWGGDGYEIQTVNVDADHRRKGVARFMLELARQHFGTVVHSSDLTEDGRAWSEKVAWKPGDTVGWINEVIVKDYPPRGGGACMIVSQVVRDEMGYPNEEGIYWSGRSLEDAIAHETVYGHWWNWKPNGDIFDGTGGQFHPSGDTVREVRKGSEEFKHYVSWRTLYDTQPVEVCERIEEIIQHAYPKFSKHAALKPGHYWRVHPSGRDWGDATSTQFSPQPGEGTRTGFSCFDNPWVLWSYVLVTWAGRVGSGDRVVAFQGHRVGTGHDGEDLVVPTTAGYLSYTWDDFEQELLTTPVPPRPWKFDSWKALASSLRLGDGVSPQIDIVKAAAKWGPVAEPVERFYRRATSDVRIMDPELTGWSGGQSDLAIYAYVGGHVAGSLLYATYDGEVYVNHIEVLPEYRRQGIATSMWSRMVESHPGMTINPGMFTDDGSAWWASMSAAKRGRVASLTQVTADFGGTWDGKHYIRFGLIPRNERSMNHVTGIPEHGVSVYRMDTAGMPIDPDPLWFEDGHSNQDSYQHIHRRLTETRHGDPAFVVTGTEIGTGEDGEPVLHSVEVVAEWDPREPLSWRDTDWKAEWEEWGKPQTHFGKTASIDTDQIREHLKDVDLPEHARDGDCLWASGAVLSALKDHGWDAHNAFVTGYLDFNGQKVVGWMHSVTVLADGTVVDATATQFDRSLPSLIIESAEDYKQRMAKATGVQSVEIGFPSGRTASVCKQADAQDVYERERVLRARLGDRIKTSMGACQNLLRRILKSEGVENAENAYIEESGDPARSMIGMDHDGYPPTPFVLLGSMMVDTLTTVHEAAHIVELRRRGAWGNQGRTRDEAHDASFMAVYEELLQKWMGERLPKAASVEVAFTEGGEYGNRTHITMEERGTIPVEVVAHMPGKMGEVPGAHARRHGEEWEAFKRDLSENGMHYGIFICVTPGEPIRVWEGNHRRDAAVELGWDEIPVQIRYFGHAERDGTLMERWERDHDPRWSKVASVEDYGGMHQPSADGPPVYDLTDESGDWSLPADIYDKPEWYTGFTEPQYLSETMATLRACRGKPDAMVRIYRALPPGHTKIEHGNWVSLSLAYAKGHAMDAYDESKDWPVITAEVPARFVRHAGDDLMEYGYWGPGVNARTASIQREGAIALPPLHDTLYPAVFDGLKVRPEVKAALYSTVNAAMPEGTKGQVRLWLEGSGASFNWDEGGDLDVQVWVALATPVGTTAAVREALSPMHGAPLTSIGIDGTMEIQFYVHAGDGTPEDALKAKPYALYDLDTDTWAVMPVPQTPAMYAERFQRAQGPASAYADQAEQAMGALDRANQSIEFAKATGLDPAPYEDQAAIANQQIRDLYAHIKDGRAQAYGPGGDGLYDVRDTIVKVLEAWGIWQRLVALVDPLPAADPVPAA